MARAKEQAAVTAAGQFAPTGYRVLEVRAYGNGNVHDTFLVTLGRAQPAPHLDIPSELPFILQSLNTRVFRQPELVMGNLRTCTRHVGRRLEQDPLGGGRCWQIPLVLAARNGRDLWLDPEGSCWRALSYIDGARTFDAIQDSGQAQEVGYGLGRFHSLLSDLPPESLADTLPGFHVTPGYLRHYDEVLAGRGAMGRSPEMEYCLKFVEDRRFFASVLEDARERGKLKLRPIHGDPKVNNVMLDTVSGRAVAMIDLDTVKPGLVHYDIGDCLRSGCNTLGEETEDWERVSFDTDLGRAMLKGYLGVAGEFLTRTDYEYLFEAARLLAFELGLRFFTDYLGGNVYFKARHPEHNLARALVQFKLTESIEGQEAALRAIVREESKIEGGGQGSQPPAPAIKLPSPTP